MKKLQFHVCAVQLSVTAIKLTQFLIVILNLKLTHGILVDVLNVVLLVVRTGLNRMTISNWWVN